MLFWQLCPGIFQALVAGGFSKPGIELAVLWTSSLWTCALASNADVSPSACGVGIQRLFTPTSEGAGLASWASSVPTAGMHFAICVRQGTMPTVSGVTYWTSRSPLQSLLKHISPLPTASWCVGAYLCIYFSFSWLSMG